MKIAKVEEECRVLARIVITGSGVKRLSVIDMSSAYLCVTPFDLETAFTIFIDGMVVCMRDKSGCSENLLYQYDFGDRDTEELYRYLMQKNALGTENDPSADIVLYQIVS